MSDTINDSPLVRQLRFLNSREELQLAAAATLSARGLRRSPEYKFGYRQAFAVDADRILHSRAYSRYIDKTQVFSLVANDHITHRVLHVQLVARIARTIGRFLNLNEDLLEAISLGHDIGHPPFGHDGEKFLSALCREHGLPAFQHNVQSVRFLDCLERKGRGWNLTLQVLDGILCHDGEVHAERLAPQTTTNFAEFDIKLANKTADPDCTVIPSTLEGCVVRLADTIAYIGRDFEDAILLGLIERSSLPKRCRNILGNTNGTIVYRLVTDLLTNSSVSRPGNSFIGFSKEIAEALALLKRFNYQKIYLAPQIKGHIPFIKECYRRLFEDLFSKAEKGVEPFLEKDSGEGDGMTPQMIDNTAAAKVRDHIAGMTDDYFLRQAARLGCQIPPKEHLITRKSPDNDGHDDFQPI